MPSQNTSQPLQVRGALSRNQPEAKPVENPFPMLPTVFDVQQSAKSLLTPQTAVVNPEIRAAAPTLFNADKTLEAFDNMVKTPLGPPAPSGLQRRAEINKQLPGRDIPVIGNVLQGIDKVQELTQPAAKVAEQFYTPGAGITAIGAGTQAAGSLLSKLAPKIGMGSGVLPAIGREAFKEAAVGAPLGAGQSLASNPQGGLDEAAKQAMWGSLFGAAGGGLLAGAVKGAGAVATKFGEDAIGNLLQTSKTIQQAAELPTTGPLKFGDNATYVNKVMSDIKPVVFERMTPPLENPNELAKWLKPHLGDVSLNDVRKLSYEDMRQLATDVQSNMDMFTIAKQAAKERGYDLDSLLSGNTPSVSKEVDRLRMGRAAGAIDAPISVRYALSDGTPKRVVTPNPTPDIPVAEATPAAPIRTSDEVIDAIPVNAQIDTPTPIQATRAPRASSQERGFVNTLRQSDNVDPGVKEGLEQSSDRNYKKITNLGTLKRANDRIERRGIDQAEAQLLGKTKFKADDVATGMRLIQKLQDAGEIDRAVSIAEKVSKQLTEAGQTVQAASIWNRLSPEGALLAAQRKVSRINENSLRGQAEVKISPTQAQGITDAAGAIQAAGGSQERAGTVMEIMERVRKGEAISAAEKQTVADFVADAKRFLKPSDTRPPRAAVAPKEMGDARVRDRVSSFLESQEQAALERIRGRRGQANALPLDEWADYAIVGATKLGKSAIKFSDWSEQMVKELGENVRPYLREIFQKSQEFRNQSAKKINDEVISKAERVAESFIKQKGDQLAPTDVDFIRNMAQKVSSLADKERRLASQDLQALMSSFEKVGVGRKLAAAQYIAMLLNPLTQIRNVVGNEMMYRLERMTKLISTPIDIAASKITGGPRTVTFKSGPSVWDDYFKPSKDYWSSLGEGMSAGWRGVSPEGLTSKYELQGQAFRSKYNPVTYMEKSLGAALQGFDYAAYTRATNQTMSEMGYLDALNKGIKGKEAIWDHIKTYITNIDDAAHDIAKQYGKFATLQDDSMFAQKLMGFRRGVNKITTGSSDFGAGSLIVPFAKTPANLLLRGLDYSPAGFLKSIKQAHDVLRSKNTDLTRADVINSVTRAFLGTGMGVGAYWLADKGALFGQSNKDPEVRKLAQSTGIKDFQINGSAVMRMIEALGTGGDVDKAAKLQPGDTLWAYQWAQPSSMPMAIGSNVYQSVKDKQGLAQTAGEAALAGASTLLDSSLLAGIREAFQIPSGESNAFKAVAMNLIKQAPSQFVPSMMRQFNTLFDDKVRETYSTDTLGKITNSAESQIPGLAQQMPQRVDTLGNPQTKPNSFFDVFVSPAARSQYNPTPEAQLVMDLLNETGDKNLAPRAVPKYLSGKDSVTGLQRKVNLTPEQFVELQSIVGRETANRLKKIDPSLPTDTKIKRVLAAFDEAGKIGRNKIKQDVGLKKAK